MISYIIRRILLVFPTLLGITLIVFFTMGLSPGGVGGPLLNQQGAMKAEVAKAMRDYYNKRYGLDQPLWVQYGRWLNEISPIGFPQHEDGSFGSLSFKTPDLGTSFAKGRPVVDLFAEAIPVTLLLNVVTFPIIYGIAIGSGILAAKGQGKWFDVWSGVAFMMLWSIPTIWAGVMLIGFMSNQQYKQWFPTSGLHDTLAENMAFLPVFTAQGFQRGWLLDTLWHLALPVIVLTYGSFAFLSRLTRSSMLENLQADFVRTARAKGVGEQAVFFRHVFRTSLLPLITIAASIIPGLLAGAVIVENIFSIPGMGRLMLQAVNMRDRELVLAEALVGGLIGLLSNLLADICYVIADPRVSYE